jgi:hypothetical protein
MNLLYKSQTTSNDENSSDEEYIIKANICKRIAKELNLPEINYDVSGEYIPPKKSGLSNSNVIIPAYYQLHKHPSRILDIDFFEMIKDDIRNCRVLNEYQLDYIKGLSHESKDELVNIFNNCVKLFSELN